MANLAKTVADITLRSLQEECTDVKGEQTGEIPKWLSGDVLRNGAGLFEIGETTMNHLFDGLSVLHRYHFDNGSVTYSNKFLKSETYTKAKETNRLVLSQFGTVATPDPCKTMWDRFMTRFEPNSRINENANVTICAYGDQIYAATESPETWKITKDLETVEKVNFTKYLAINHSTAHIHIEKDGTVYNVGNSYAGGPHYNIVKFPPPPEDKPDDVEELFKQAKVVASIPSRWRFHPGYYHSFAMTENYLIFIEQPLCISVPSALTKQLRGAPISGSLVWFGKEKNRFYIISKKTGEVLSQKYQSEVPFTFFHTINAFEENDDIVLDINAYPDGDLINRFYRKHLEGYKFTEPSVWGLAWRFVLPLKPNKDVPVGQNLTSVPFAKSTAYWDKNDFITCTYEDIPKADNFELARINYNLNGKRYRYFYGLGGHGKIIKADWNTHEVLTWQEEDSFATEPIFVEKPGATEEDEGVLLSAVLKRCDPTLSELIVLDARTLVELGRARFKTPSPVPFTFHGMFLGSKDKIHKM